MNGSTMVILILALVTVIMGGMYFFIPFLVKKGIDISATLGGAKTALATADTVIDGLVGIFPENKGLTIINSIIEYAKKGAETAEKLYKTSQIAADQRKEKAKELVYECLGIAEIEITDDIRAVVDGMIEAAVFALPKTHEDECDVPDVPQVEPIEI